MNLRKALEKNGFNVEKTDGGWYIGQYTPAGEDWGYDVETLGEMIQIIEEFDPEEEFGMWMEARYHGREDIPRPSELWKDQEWKQKVLEKVLEDYDEEV